MIKGPWNYDERTGMVAVYPGEKLNCLDGIGNHAIYSRCWRWNDELKQYQQSEEDKEIGRLVAAAPDLLSVAQFVVQATVGNIPPGIVQAAKDAIEKAEGRA